MTGVFGHLFILFYLFFLLGQANDLGHCIWSLDWISTALGLEEHNGEKIVTANTERTLWNDDDDWG